VVHLALVTQRGEYVLAQPGEACGVSISQGGSQPGILAQGRPDGFHQRRALGLRVLQKSREQALVLFQARGDVIAQRHTQDQISDHDHRHEDQGQRHQDT